MPQLANHEKIIALFADVLKSDAQRAECALELKRVMEKSNLDQEYCRFRYQAYKKLVKLVKTRDDVLLAIGNHDILLKSITRTTDEDITGYHHAYSLSELSEWMRISRDVRELMEIIKSYTPHTTAKMIAERNKKKLKI